MPNRRTVTFILLPVLIFIFMTGWILYKAPSSPKVVSNKQKQLTPKDTSMSNLEIGAISELKLEEETVIEA